MLHYLLICRSLTYAQRAARVLERSGITAIVKKAPRSAGDVSCRYSVRISEKKLDAALIALSGHGVEPIKIFLESQDGTVSEVAQK